MHTDMNSTEHQEGHQYVFKKILTRLSAKIEA